MDNMGTALLQPLICACKEVAYLVMVGLFLFDACVRVLVLDSNSNKLHSNLEETFFSFLITFLSDF